MSDKPKADPWLRPHDDKLRNLLREGHVSSSDTRRPTLIAIAQEHFPTTFIAGDKKSVDNRVKLLRRKINNYRLGISKEGARQGQGRSVMLLLLCIYTSSTDTSLFVHHLSHRHGRQLRRRRFRRRRLRRRRRQYHGIIKATSTCQAEEGASRGRHGWSNSCNAEVGY